MPSDPTTFAPFRLTICGIPELDEHCAAGVTHVLSILAPDIEDPPAFDAFAPHRRLTLRFHDIIEPSRDRLPPGRADVERLLAFGRELAETPEGHLLIHCQAGVSRSTAAAALILAQARPDRPAREALEAVSQIRPRAWPNLRILEFGDELLGRNGEMVAAVAAIYRRVLDRDPDFQEAMIEGGRSREVLAALSLDRR
ncbi:MAG: dual specificity protein phosphatase family protein [Alphaproteobacteria bacterium]|nr:dual specificity protein phosphatase family protein [Alphaproteobacteria bacterium]MBV9016071.1 dual specificity protein phosphatase family protein [Alphaproteobacteria bacterium]MBV9152589.1 dual specificity protein phosphatase family protein [Alphaproteobacteria bacterium]MBV9586641.1 dual specificity protein phosphatase family protein [Alphaproteobacteria bacterium]MBV9965030.1 dual specificity protein phosphatase family protein [Alphaproteobacteria bacterium]